MHISHSICEIMGMFWENDMILMPGGQQTFCNDFCVDLCINSEGDDFDCDVESCLDNCGAHFDRYEMAGYNHWSSSSSSSSCSSSSSSSSSRSSSSSSGSSSYDIDFEGDYERYEVDDQGLMGADGHDEAYYEMSSSSSSGSSSSPRSAR